MLEILLLMGEVLEGVYNPEWGSWVVRNLDSFIHITFESSSAKSFPQQCGVNQVLLPCKIRLETWNASFCGRLPVWREPSYFISARDGICQDVMYLRRNCLYLGNSKQGSSQYAEPKMLAWNVGVGLWKGCYPWGRQINGSWPLKESVKGVPLIYEHCWSTHVHH